MNDEIRLDRETFKALAADTRVSILKALSKRRMTGAELAVQVKLSPSTIKEHLDQLEKASLIEQIDEGRKWKYYALTFKGRQITTTERPSMRVWIVLGISILALAFTTLNLFFLQGSLAAPSNMLAAQQERGDFAMTSAYDANTTAPKSLGASVPTVDPCGAAPNSCLTSEVASDSPMIAASRAAGFSSESVVPSPRQVGMIDLALEAALIFLVLGLGYYALKQKRNAAYSEPRK